MNEYIMTQSIILLMIMVVSIKNMGDGQKKARIHQYDGLSDIFTADNKGYQ